MLVLTRKRGERILIGHEIAVTLLRISGDRVRIGIEAPDHLPIVREEIAVITNCDEPASNSRRLARPRHDFTMV